MMGLYVLCCNRGFRVVFTTFGCVIELSSHDEQAPGQLSPIRSIVADRKPSFTLGDYEASNIHF